MEDSYVLKMGSKGEIFPPKEVREHLGLKKGQPILMKINGKRIVVEKLDSLKDFLNRDTNRISVSYHVLQSMESEFD